MDSLAEKLAAIKGFRHGDAPSPYFPSSAGPMSLAARPEEETRPSFPLAQKTPVHPTSTMRRVPATVSLPRSLSTFSASPGPSLAGPSLAAAAGPSTGPRVASYGYFVYPRETLFPKDRKSFVWRDVPYSGDVVLSIQQNVVLANDVGLREIQITIPLGPSSLRKPVPGVKTLTGPGLAPTGIALRVRMLNNMRWVAALSVFGEGAVYLQIRIVPRADPAVYSELTATEANRELSVILSGVDTGFIGEGKKWEAGKVRFLSFFSSLFSPPSSLFLFFPLLFLFPLLHLFLPPSSFLSSSFRKCKF